MKCPQIIILLLFLIILPLTLGISQPDNIITISAEVDLSNKENVLSGNINGPFVKFAGSRHISNINLDDFEYNNNVNGRTYIDVFDPDVSEKKTTYGRISFSSIENKPIEVVFDKKISIGEVNLSDDTSVGITLLSEEYLCEAGDPAYNAFLVSTNSGARVNTVYLPSFTNEYIVEVYTKLYEKTGTHKGKDFYSDFYETRYYPVTLNEGDSITFDSTMETIQVRYLAVMTYDNYYFDVYLNSEQIKEISSEELEEIQANNCYNFSAHSKGKIVSKSKVIEDDYEKPEIDEVNDWCLTDNGCAEDQKCSRFKCKNINCEDGTIVDHECVEVDYECFQNSDCSNGQLCNNLTHTCYIGSICKSLIFNGDPAEKYDVVLVGDFYNTYDSYEDFLNIIDYGGNNGYYGLFSVEPFNEMGQREKFNFWYVPANDVIKRDVDSPRKPDTDELTYFAEEMCKTYFMNAVPDMVIAVSKLDFRSSCYTNVGPCRISVDSGVDQVGFLNRLFGLDKDGRLLLHEFGHGFAGLADEYYNNEKDEDYGLFADNCVESEEIANGKWEEFLNLSHIDFYYGCGGDCDKVCKNYIRPTKNSIMRHQDSLKDDFYEVNEAIIRKKLNVIG